MPSTCCVRRVRKPRRELTQSAGIALIFDDVLLGFRIHQGGSQAHFGIRADMATYGKIVGGGMPIGVVTSSARFMDRLDPGYVNQLDATNQEIDSGRQPERSRRTL